MKLVCVDVEEVVKVKTGIFSSQVVRQKMDGITEGKIYVGDPIAICNNDKWEGSNVSRTKINFEDYGFLIYDDNGEWNCYDFYHFKPAE